MNASKLLSKNQTFFSKKVFFIFLHFFFFMKFFLIQFFSIQNRAEFFRFDRKGVVFKFGRKNGKLLHRHFHPSLQSNHQRKLVFSFSSPPPPLTLSHLSHLSFPSLAFFLCSLLFFSPLFFSLSS